MHDGSGGWSLPLLICIASAGLMGAFGYRAGQAGHIQCGEAPGP